MGVDILGWVGFLGLLGFYIPQLVSLVRARGLNPFAWCSLLIATVALALDAFLIGWWAGAAANAVGAVAVALSLYFMRKRRPRSVYHF